MSDAQQVTLTLPRDPRYVATVRLTLAGVATRMGFDYQAIEDMKVAVSEACTNAIEHAAPVLAEGEDAITVSFVEHPHSLEVRVADRGPGFDATDERLWERKDMPAENGLGLFLIRSLVDEVSLQKGKTAGMIVRMVKRLER